MVKGVSQRQMGPERSCTQRNGSLNHSLFSVLLKFHFYREKCLIRILILTRNLMKPPTALLKY